MEDGFSALRRRTLLYLVALWGRLFTLVPGESAASPYIEDERIVLPSWTGAGMLADPPLIYRAMAVHAAAHVMYGGEGFVRASLKPRQVALIELLEDARVEALAIERFPGLRALWLRQQSCEPLRAPGFPGLCARLTRSLLDPRYEDNNHWVVKGRALFDAHRRRWSDTRLAYELGLLLAHDLGQMRIPMRDQDLPAGGAYRDDNRHLWREPAVVESLVEQETQLVPRMIPAEARWEERRDGRPVPFAALQPPATTQGFVIEPAASDAALEFHAARAIASPQNTFTYAEYDYRTGIRRAGWCTVQDAVAASGAGNTVTEILTRHRHTLRRLRRSLHNARSRNIERLRHQKDGEEIDLGAAIDALADLASGGSPDERVYLRHRVPGQVTLSVLVLLDLSESANAAVGSQERTLLDLTREAAALLGETLAHTGDAFAIHGFCSDGRHAVYYERFKDFDERYDDAVRDRLGALHARLSTRMGAAVRHAGHLLAAQGTQRKLLLVVTDGAPADIDVFDDAYLAADAHRAVGELHAADIRSFCVSLDPHADEYARAVFGAHHYIVLDRVEQLPERLPILLLRLAQHR